MTTIDSLGTTNVKANGNSSTSGTWGSSYGDTFNAARHTLVDASNITTTKANRNDIGNSSSLSDGTSGSGSGGGTSVCFTNACQMTTDC